MIRLDLEFEETEDSFIAKFSLHVKDVQFCSFYIFEPEMLSKQEYLDFSEGKLEELNFCDSNGNVSMTWTDKNTIKCEVSRFGAGGGGSSICYLPGDLAKPKLRELANRFN